MQIVIIREAAETLQKLRSWLKEGWPQSRIAIAADTEQGLQLIKEAATDLAIIGSDAPDETGALLCRQIRHFSDIPLIKLSRGSHPQEMAGVLEAGADQYLTTTCPKSVFLAHVTALLRRAQTGSDLLTGLHTTHPFDDTMAKELERARRYKYPISLLWLEVAGLEGIVKVPGKIAAPEAALTKVMQIVRNHLRSSDTVTRCGVGKFLALLPASDHTAATVVGNRLKQNIEAFCDGEATLRGVTGVKLGTHSWNPATKADVASALRAAKRHARPGARGDQEGNTGA